MIDATGPLAAARAQDPLIGQLIERGLARLDRHGIGVDVTGDFRCVDAAGRSDRPLWAIGPIVRGTFWECTAVPEIRQHAAALADGIAKELAAC